MRQEDEFTKKSASVKKRQRRIRRVKVVLVLAAIVIAISLIFYTLDNPDFLKNMKNKLISFYSNDSASTLIEADTAAAADIDADNTGESPGGWLSSIWQQFMAFFTRRLRIDEEKLPSNLDIKVYFASLGEEEKFVYEERTINAGDIRIAVENAIRELLDGPEKSFHYPVIPPGTKLLDVEIYENTVKINLSQEFLENSLDSGILDEYVIYTIVNTVTQIPGIEGVVFFIDGIRIKTYGNVDLSIPAINDEKYIDTEET